jgi:exosortase H (IPTLxxWG-CTERM-specific)
MPMPEPRKTTPAAGRPPASAKRFVWPFLSICAVFYGLSAWLPDSFFEPVNRYTAIMTAFLLARLGFRPVLDGVLISLDGFNAKIITECSAVMVLLLFCAFVLSYPADARKKAAGLLLGVPVLLGANFVRLILVYLTGSRFPDLFEMVHIYLGQMFMVALVFAACLYWLRSLARSPVENDPLAFLVRFVAFSAIPFVVWIYIHRSYVQLDAWIVEGLFKLVGYDLHLSPKMDIVYPNTFNLIAFTGLILATGGT